MKILFALSLLSLFLPSLQAQAKSEEAVMQAGGNAGLKIEAGVSFTEGPAWHAPSKSVFFTDISNNRIMRKPVSVPRKYRAGIYVIDPDGKGLVRFIPIPADDITNCIFGGDTGNTLYITAGHRLFSIEID